MPESCRSYFTLLLPKAHFPAVMKDHLRENPTIHACMTSWQNTWTYQTVTHDVSPHITHELLLVSGMDCTTLIFLCPLILVEKIRDSLSTKSCLFYERHWRDKEWISGLLNKPSTTILPWWVMSKMNWMGRQDVGLYLSVCGHYP